MNSLPKTVTQQRRDCYLNPGPTAPESSTLTTRLPSHPSMGYLLLLLFLVILTVVQVHGVRVLPSPTTSRLAAGHGAKPGGRLARSPAIRAPRPPPPPPPPGDDDHATAATAPRWASRRRGADVADEGPRDRQQRHRYGRCAEM